MSNFALYMIGVAILAAGLGYGAHLMGIPLQWIAVIGLVVLGIGILGAIKKTRHREPPGD